MKNWCKIIKLENHDVLVQRLSSDEDGEHISFTLVLDGVIASYKAGYKEDEKLADETYEKFCETEAQKMLTQTLEMFNETEVEE